MAENDSSNSGGEPLARANGPPDGSAGPTKAAEPVRLEEFFELQAEFNRRVGFDAAALRERFDSLEAGRWLNNYIAAASNELEELRDCTFWKHWCREAQDGQRFAVHDLQNARVEVIDLLFFWISLAQCLGLDAADVRTLYMQKLQVNHDRQSNSYSMHDKNETDNRTIVLDD